MARSKKGVLVIDDDETIHRLFTYHLEQWGFQSTSTATLAEARKKLQVERFELVLLDISLPDGSGTDFLAEVRKSWPRMQVIMVSAHGDIEMAMDCVRNGAFDFVPKPMDLDRLEVSVRNAVKLAQSETEITVLRDLVDGRDSFGAMLGSSPTMQVVYEVIENVAAANCSVLVTGETGTGKELVAAEIHARSKRASRELIAVNCAAFPKDLLESEMFGHEKGAFTGAANRKIGCAERADKSTLFLDEIGEMPMELQSKLLRFLQDYKVTRVGGDTAIKVDIRLVCATNRDPLTMVEDKILREDLLYRINVVRIVIPPLRERRTDIPLLCKAFLAEAASENGKAFREFDKEAMARLCAYGWPGNIRQLKNVVTEVVILNQGEVVESGMLPPEIQTLSSDSPPDESQQNLDSRILPMWKVEKEHIRRTILRTGGNISEAARLLEISKATIYRKVKEFDIRLDSSDAV